MTRTERKFVYVSPAITRLLGWSPDALQGKDILDFCHPDDVSGVLDALRRLSAAPEVHCRTRLLHANGSFTWMEARACLAPQPVNTTAAPTLVVNARSIAARKYIEDDLQNARRRLEELSVSDSLTGLANRRKFDESLDVECRRAQRDRSSACLLMLDLDNFKLLNDTCGQAVGDSVLRSVAAVLASFAQRAGDLAARCSGDEFALLLPNTDLEQAENIAEKLRAAVALLDPPINFPSFLSISIGLCSTDHSRLSGTPGQLLNLADEALHAAKHNGKNQVHVLRDLGRGQPGMTSGASRMHH
jgi:diguanylate cyclase (GGDEF)-like protein/PAS domain S-box-containing protein